MALRTNRGRPGEVSLTKCPFPECGVDIPDCESFARHWPNCKANPANGGIGGLPSQRKAARNGSDD